LCFADAELVVGLAFRAAVGGVFPIDEFLRKTVARFTAAVIGTFLEPLKNLVVENGQSSPTIVPALLNPVFAFIWDVFPRLTDDVKLQTNTVYSMCESIEPSVAKFAFSEALPSIRTSEVRQAASAHFSDFLTGKVTVDDLIHVMRGYRQSSPLRFHAMQHYLLTEMKYLSQHSTRSSERLVGRIAQEGLFFAKQLDIVFCVCEKGFGLTASPSLSSFATATLEICYHRLLDLPAFVQRLLHQPLLRTAHPRLHAAIQELSAHVGRNAALSLHPRLARFANVAPPPPKVCRVVLQLDSGLDVVLPAANGHHDWLALHCVNLVLDRQKQLPFVAGEVITQLPFSKIVTEARADWSGWPLLARTMGVSIGSAFSI
jgi:hypothetical protein